MANCFFDSITMALCEMSGISMVPRHVSCMNTQEKLLNKRIIGVDFLRLVCMYMIVVHHILFHGGILYQAEPGSTSYCFAWMLNTLCYCSVNAFGIISGLVGYKSRHSTKGMMALWLAVFFWSLLVGIIGWVFGIIPFTPLKVMTVCFPVTFGLYWYFSAYCCLYFIMPAIDVAVEHLSGRRLVAMIIALLFMFFVANRLQTSIGVGHGYRFVWLAYLYFVGASLSKYNICARIQFSGKGCLAFGYFLTALLVFASHYLLLSLNRLLSRHNEGRLLSNYNSPFMLLEALFLLTWFYGLKLKALSHWIGKMSACAFGIYIIHQHPTIEKALFKDNAVWMLSYNPLAMIACVLLMGWGIYLACLLLEYYRSRLFLLLSKTIPIHKLFT